jgi:hypothetical protein
MASLCMLQGLGFPAGDSMSTVPLFDPNCPWKASCKSRRITTSAGLLRHLQRYHNLGESGRDEWVSKLRSPEEYGKLDAILRTTSTWLCTRASKPIPWEFFRAQPTQTHASACGIWRMAWFPLMLTYFLAFLGLHRRRISHRRILQSPKAASLRSPEDDRAHPPLLLILRPLLPRPVSAAIP